MFTLFHSPLERLNEELKELEKELERLLVFIEKKSVPLIKNSKGKEIIDFLKKGKEVLESSRKNIGKIKSPNLPLELISINERIIKIIEAIELILKNSKTNPFYYLSNDFLENLKRIRSYFSGEFGVIPVLLKIIDKLEQIITKQKESRRSFIKLGAAHAVLLALSQLGIKDETKLKTLGEALIQKDYETIRKILKKETDTYTGNPKIEFRLPKIEDDPELKEYYIEKYLNPLRTILAGEKFSLKESINSIFPFGAKISDHLNLRKDLTFPIEGQSGIAVNFISEESYQVLDQNIFANGFALLPNHAITMKGENLLIKRDSKIPEKEYEEKRETDISPKKVKILSEKFEDLIAYSKEMDLAFTIFEVWDNSTIKSKRGVTFTTDVFEGEPVFMVRTKKSENFKYGSMEKGEVLLTSYYKKQFFTIDFILTTLKAYKGDRGSPLFNSRGEVIGMIFGVAQFRTNEPQAEELASLSLFVSSKCCLYFLREVETNLSIKLKA